MNTTIPLNRLVAMLALNENLSEEVARKFVLKFFNVIEQTLAEGDAVTVKDLGMFNVTKSGVVFTADSEFASKVNNAFEIFQPTVLDDDFDVSLIDEESNAGQDADAIEVHIEIEDHDDISDADISEVTAPSTSSELNESSDEQTLIGNETIEESSSSLPVDDISPDDASAKNLDDVPREIESAVNHTPAQSLVAPVVEKTQSQSTEMVVYTPLAVAENNESRSNRIGGIIMWIGVGLVGGFLAGILWGYVGRDKISNLISSVNTDAQVVSIDSVIPAELDANVVVASDSTASATTLDEAVVENERPSVAAPVVEIQTISKPVDLVATHVNDKTPSRNDLVSTNVVAQSETVTEQPAPVSQIPTTLAPESVSEVQSTAPIVVKREKTEAKTSGTFDKASLHQHLIKLAREHYGSKEYWVYVYQANASKLRKPEQVPVDISLIIPDFDEYRTSDDNKQNLDDAKYMGAQIYSRYFSE